MSNAKMLYKDLIEAVSALLLIAPSVWQDAKQFRDALLQIFSLFEVMCPTGALISQLPVWE